MADTSRMQALRNLSAQLPVANKKVAAGQQAARDMQLQQAVQKAPPGAITSTAQQTGAASAAQAGQQAVQQAQQGVQQAGQVGQIGLAEQATQSQAELGSLQAGAREQEMSNVQRLASVSERAKQELYDQSMKFERDEAGRSLFNQRQLADYAKMNAESDEQLRNYSQAAEQLSQRKLQAMEHAYRILEQDLNQKYASAKQQNDQQQMTEILAMKRQFEQQMQKEAADAANRGAMWQTAGTIAGAAVGALGGGPAGAMVGASVGGGLGTAIGGQA